MADYPAMMLWTDAYLADTTHLRAEEHGAYLLLLMTSWRSKECALADEDELLARVCRVTVERWRTKLRPILAPFFTIEDGLWTQKRLRLEREKLEILSKVRRAAAHAKHLKDKETAPAHAGANGMLSRTRTKTNKKETPNGVSKEPASPDLFREFYAAYPRKVGPGKAEVAYRAATRKTSHAEIMDGLRRAKLAWERKGTPAEYIPHPATWLNGGRWADDDFIAGNGTADVIGDADRMTRNILRKMNGNGCAEEFAGTHHVVSDRPAPGIWHRPEDDPGTSLLAEWPVH